MDALCVRKRRTALGVGRYVHPYDERRHRSGFDPVPEIEADDDKRKKRSTRTTSRGRCERDAAAITNFPANA